ncbi:MAG TPA: OsmC family protein [Nocardioides sp.]|nr:OsmC family protein [Nocardioides sp.]
MSDGSERSIEITRLAKGRYVAENTRGGRLEFGAGTESERFSPVELFLTAVAGCTAIDVDYITSKRAEPEHFSVTMTGDKIRDEDGCNRLVNLTVRLDLRFPDDEGGTAAREVLPSAVQRSHDRLCTVSRTVEDGTPVDTGLA